MRNILNFKWNISLAGICLGIFLCSCQHSDPVAPEKEDKRVVLIYMAADNNLSSYSEENLKLVLRGMEKANGRMVIYVDSRNDVPHLLTIKGGRGCVLDTLEIYPEENSASAEVLSRVIEDTKERYPSDSYGLILWSHGMGWLPADYSFPRSSFQLQKSNHFLQTKFFSTDEHIGESSYMGCMEVKDLSEALSSDFDFILFDACFMSAIEVLYELRMKTNYFIVSPAEVIANGFPYDKITPLLWGKEEDLKQICGEFYNFYNTHPDTKREGWQSATIALIKAEELEPLMASAREILQGRIGFNELNVWSYPLSDNSLPDVFFDLGDYIRQVATEAQWTFFQKQLNRTVIYKAATPTFFFEPIPATKYSGLSTYIPLSQWSQMNRQYQTLSWPQSVY